MFISYHLIYYAIGLLLNICALYYNKLIYIISIGYLFFIYKRLDIKHVFIVLMLTLCVYIRPEQSFQYPTYIEGVVTKVSDKYVYVKVQGYSIKLYNDHEFKYNDYIQVNIEYIDILNNTNDNAFNEEVYLKGQKVVAKASLKSVVEIQHRKTLYHYIEEQLSDNEIIRGYQRLLLLGEKSEDIDEEYRTLSDLSLVHLFALSGMHISILYSLISGLLGILLSKRTSQYLSYLLIGIYVFSIPFSISLSRAFLTMILYELFRKHFNKLDIFAFLLICSLFYNACYIYNVSFIYSYLIYFIVLITKSFKNSFMYIYLASLPIVLILNYEFSVLSMLFADVLSPFIEIFYTFNCLVLIFPFLEKILLISANSLNNIINFLDLVSLRILVGKPNLSFIILYYIIYCMILVGKEKNKNVQKYVCLLISLLISFSVYSRYKMYGQVTMIDVGQGDCTLIRMPMNRGNILIDTGGNKNYDLATQTIIPYLKSVGISHLDYVYVSHDDFDHNGALESLVNNFPVYNIIDSYESYRCIYDTQIKMIQHSYSHDSNDNSLIMHITLPSLTLLFMGDASTLLENEIINNNELYADVIKIGHHGSYTSTSSLLLDRVKPKIAMIGVKKNNIYKHPSQEVIDRLNRKGIKILRTDINGMFHIRYYGDKKYYIYE